MRLVDEIVEMAADGKTPLADVLRKCLILAFELKNEKLKGWTEKELNGYEKNDDELPPYRSVSLHSVGNFTGPVGAWIPKRPLPMGVLEKRDQDYLMKGQFPQPVATYDTPSVDGKRSNAVINWPPDLIAKYQGKFIEGYALSQAWQEVPAAVMIGLCEEVRNRMLRFALEIREELGRVEDKVSEVPASTVEAAVVNYIFGGTNVIAGTAGAVAQSGNIVIAAGDFGALSEALKGLEVPEAEIKKLEGAIEADHRGFGQRTREWLAKVATTVGKGGVKASAAVGQEVIKELLLRYFGLK